MSDYEGGTRGVGMVGKRVEVVSRSGRWAGCVVYCTAPGAVEHQSKTLYDYL